MKDVGQGQQHASLWTETTPATDYPALDGPMSVDVAIVGGGITGLTTALLLKQSGARVAVIERRRIASGTTGHTTAKITSLHGMIYGHLIDIFGHDGAQLYADANQAAIVQIES